MFRFPIQGHIFPRLTGAAFMPIWYYAGMMPFDLAVLSTHHFWLFGSSFLVTTILIRLLQEPGKLQLHRKTGTNVFFAGGALVVVSATAASFALSDPVLALGLWGSAAVVLVMGVLDERHELAPAWQLLGQGLIATIVIASGWRVMHVTHPFEGGVIQLVSTDGSLTLLAAVVTVGWVLALINAINWIDGSDGLAGGVGFIALMTLAAISLLPQTQDATTVGLAVAGAGSVLGFLIWNAPPARVYLGTVGSWWLGLYIAITAIVGGGKVATALLVLALPVIDACWVLVQRRAAGAPLWTGDKRHLHHRLKKAGYSPRIIFIGAMALSVVLGVAAVVLQTYAKLIALLVAAAMILLGSAYLILRRTRRST